MCNAVDEVADESAIHIDEEMIGDIRGHVQRMYAGTATTMEVEVPTITIRIRTPMDGDLEAIAEESQTTLTAGLDRPVGIKDFQVVIDPRRSVGWVEAGEDMHHDDPCLSFCHSTVHYIRCIYDIF